MEAHNVAQAFPKSCSSFYVCKLLSESSIDAQRAHTHTHTQSPGLAAPSLHPQGWVAVLKFIQFNRHRRLGVPMRVSISLCVRHKKQALQVLSVGPHATFTPGHCTVGSILHKALSPAVFSAFTASITLCPCVCAFPFLLPPTFTEASDPRLQHQERRGKGFQGRHQCAGTNSVCVFLIIQGPAHLVCPP